MEFFTGKSCLPGEKVLLTLTDDTFVLERDDKVFKSFKIEDVSGFEFTQDTIKFGDFQLFGQPNSVTAIMNILKENKKFKSKMSVLSNSSEIQITPKHTSIKNTTNSKSEKADIGHALISGFTKARANPFMKGNLIIKKTEYFCILGQSTLYYSPSETDEQPKGEYSLRVYETVEIENEAKFQFKLTDANGKSVILTSLMKETMNSWVNAIQKVLDLLKGGLNFAEQSETTYEHNMYIKVWAGKAYRNAHDTFVSLMANGEEKTRTSIEWHTTDPNHNQDFDIILPGSSSSIVFGVYDIRNKMNFNIGNVSLPVEWNQAPYDRNKVKVDEEVKKEIEQGIPQAGPNWYDLQVTTQRELYITVEISKNGSKYGFQIKQLTGGATCPLNSPNKELYRIVAFLVEPPKGKSKTPTFTELFRTPDSKDGNFKNLTKIEFDGGKELRFEAFEISSGYEDCIGMYGFLPNELDGASQSVNNKYSLKSINPGYLRVEMSPTVLCILPDSQYDDLLGLILEDDFNLAKMLSKCVSPQRVTAMSHSLVRACERKRTAVGFVKSLLREEIRALKTYDVAFRGNTLATKSMEYYMKLIALPQLHKVLKPLIAEILQVNKKKPVTCEIDPVRLEGLNEKQKKQALAKNVPILEKYCQMAFNAIQELLDILPVSLRVILSDMKKGFHDQFNGDDKAVHAGVTAFLFLRFIVPAISQPTVFQITANHPSKDSARTLMLTAITMQKLSNLKEFGDGKEPHMMVLNDFIRKTMQKMQQFIETMATVPSKKIDSIPVDHSTLVYGREMALVAKYIDEAMANLEKEYGNDHATLVKLRLLLAQLKSVEGEK